jgi:hypothetical protein
MKKNYIENNESTLTEKEKKGGMKANNDRGRCMSHLFLS